MKKIVGVFFICLVLVFGSIPYNVSSAQENGYWHLSEIRIEEKTFNMASNSGIQSISYEKPYGSYNVAVQYDTIESNGSRARYKGAFKWDPLPNYLIPQKTYNFIINAQKMEKTTSINLSCQAIIRHGLESGIDSATKIGTGVLISTSGKDSASMNQSFKASSYKAGNYIVQVNVITDNSKSTLKYNYVYKWMNAKIPSTQDVIVLIDNQQLVMDVPPIIIEDRLMVPLRSIFEALGANVNWNPKDKSITATKGSTNVYLKVDNKNAKVNAVDIVLDVPPRIVDSRTLVPVRIIAESFGASVYWDGVKRTVFIKTKF